MLDDHGDYSGPPAMVPPGTSPVGVPAIPPPPRLPPRQDHAAIDQLEADAETVTRRFGVVAAAGLTVIVVTAFILWMI